MNRAVTKRVRSVNPATGEELASFAVHTTAEIEAILEQAHNAQPAWSLRSFAERAALMDRAAAYLRSNVARFALDITREMGKPILDAEAEIEKCARACEFYAVEAEGFLADESVATTATESYIAYQPLGVVLAIMPWNFPFWQVFRFAAPALMAGNVGVLKHASNVTRCALDIEEVFRASGFPNGTFASVIIPGAEVNALIADVRVAAVTITGSEAAGISVAMESARHLKKHVLELGGSDPFIVLADADIRQAATTGARARFQNAGQSCICAKRFIVESSVYDQFVEAFVEATKNYGTGDPESRSTQMGPLARADLREDLIRQIASSVEAGAHLVLGGKSEAGAGAFFEATVLTEVDATMSVFTEETFGPVAAIVRARDAEHALMLANDSSFGLGAALWTGDTERARYLARLIQSGAVFINGMTASDPRLPFGGVKNSGYGRELSYLGIREFMNIQTVWIGPSIA